MAVMLVPQLALPAKADLADTMTDLYESVVTDGAAAPPSGTYSIDSSDELYKLAAYVSAGKSTTGLTFCLAADIVLNDVSDADDWNDETEDLTAWTPIGDNSHVFSGTFDGCGWTISGIYLSASSSDYQGLFGYLSNATVKNVGVEDSYICGHTYVGGVVGFASHSTVSNCYNAGKVRNSGDDYTGGIVGFASRSTVSHCYNTGNVLSSGYYTGGVAGLSSGTVENCRNEGSVEGYDYAVGGVVGKNSGTVSECYNTGSVFGHDNQVGGIAGCSYNTSGASTVTKCYNTGTVTSEVTSTFTATEVGGIVGRNSGVGGVLENSYNTGSVTTNGTQAGGVAGSNLDATISTCYNAGRVSSDTGDGRRDRWICWSRNY